MHHWSHLAQTFNFIDLFWFLSSVCNQSNLLDMHHCIYCKKSVSAYLPFSRTLVHVCQLTYSYIDGGGKFGIFRPICLYLGIVFSMPIFSNSSISLTPKCRGSIANSALLISSPAAVRLPRADFSPYHHKYYGFKCLHTIQRPFRSHVYNCCRNTVQSSLVYQNLHFPIRPHFFSSRPAKSALAFLFCSKALSGELCSKLFAPRHRI